MSIGQSAYKSRVTLVFVETDTHVDELRYSVDGALFETLDEALNGAVVLS